MASEVGTGLPK